MVVINRLQRELKQALIDCKNFFDTAQVAKFIPFSNPQLAQFYGLPKVHKIGVPIRPVVSGVNSVMHNLARNLHNFLATLNRPKLYSLNNSKQFVDDLFSIEDTSAPSQHMCSFDVVALYPSIPLQELYPILSTIMTDNGIEPQRIASCLTLIKLVNNSNYFVFDKHIYQQTDGLAMGSPLSAILADIYMSDFETKLLSTYPHITFWRRYVDDIFALHNLMSDRLQEFLQQLNSVNPRIQFTLETEKQFTLPFLDVQVTRNGKLFVTDVYRKPSFCPRFIDGRSFHPFSHKTSFLFSAIYRMFDLRLSPESILKELEYLRYCCLENSLDVTLVDKIYHRIVRKRQMSLTSTLCDSRENTPFYISLPFSNMHNTIARRLLKWNFRTGFSSNNTVQSMVPMVKSNINDVHKSGVYNAQCGDCEKIYVGQTRRSFKTRIHEHLHYPTKSRVCEHLLMEDHDPNKVTFRTLKTSNDYKIINVKESLEILKLFEKHGKHNILNTQLGPCNGSFIKWMFPRNPFLIKDVEVSS